MNSLTQFFICPPEVPIKFLCGHVSSKSGNCTQIFGLRIFCHDLDPCHLNRKGR